MSQSCAHKLDSAQENEDGAGEVSSPENDDKKIVVRDFAPPMTLPEPEEVWFHGR